MRQTEPNPDFRSQNRTDFDSRRGTLNLGLALNYAYACIYVHMCVVRRHAGAGKQSRMHPFRERAPARAGGPRGGRGFRAGPGRVISPARRGSIMLTPIKPIPSPTDVTYQLSKAIEK